MCPQSFTSVENLKEHEITHDADKPYICILCKKDFTLKSSLSRHILVSHGVDPCPFIDSDKCLKRVVLTQSWGQQIPIPMSDQKDAKEPSEFALSPEVSGNSEMTKKLLMFKYLYVYIYVYNVFCLFASRQM